jgi:hypothetical protein
MTDQRVCPLNNRVCRCNPNAADKKLHPCALANRIGKLVRLLASTLEGEAMSAAAALKRLVPAEGLTFNDLATLIENCNGEIEEKKYSEADAEVIFARGAEKGRAEEARKREAPSEFYDADGHPRWLEIAQFCQKNNQRLRQAEQQFIDDMVGHTTWREPTERQGKWLLSIFIKLGGRRSA